MRSDETGALSPRSDLAAAMMASLGLSVEVVDARRDPDRAKSLMARSGCPYVPQLSLNGEFIGGSSIIHEFLRSGEYARCSEAEISGTKGPLSPLFDDVRSKAVWRFAGGGRDTIVGCCARGFVTVYDAQTGLAGERHRVVDGWVNCASLVDGRDVLFCGTSSAELIAYSLTRRMVLARAPHRRWVNDVFHFPCSDTVVCADGSGHLTEWCGRSLRKVRELRVGHEPLWAAASDEAAELVAVGDGDGTLHLVDRRSWTVLARHRVDAHCVTFVTYSRFLSAFVVTGFDGAISVVDRQGVLHRQVVHDARAWSVIALADGRLLASTSADGTVRIREADDLGRVVLSKAVKSPIALAANGAHDALFVGDQEGEVHKLRIETAGAGSGPHRAPRAISEPEVIDLPAARSR